MMPLLTALIRYFADYELGIFIVLIVAWLSMLIVMLGLLSATLHMSEFLVEWPWALLEYSVFYVTA